MSHIYSGSIESMSDSQVPEGNESLTAWRFTILTRDGDYRILYTLRACVVESHKPQLPEGWSPKVGDEVAWEDGSSSLIAWMPLHTMVEYFLPRVADIWDPFDLKARALHSRTWPH